MPLHCRSGHWLRISKALLVEVQRRYELVNIVPNYKVYLSVLVTSLHIVSRKELLI